MAIHHLQGAFMIYSNYIVIAALILYAAVLISIPFRIKKSGTEGLKNRARGFWFRQAAILLAGAAIIVLCFFIHFEPLPTAALCGCGVLGAVVAVQEMFPKQ